MSALKVVPERSRPVPASYVVSVSSSAPHAQLAPSCLSTWPAVHATRLKVVASKLRPSPALYVVSVSSSSTHVQAVPFHFHTSPAAHPVVESAMVVPETSMGVSPV